MDFAFLCLFLGHFVFYQSVQFSRSVVSNSLWPHGLQHAMPPCPSPTPGVNRIYSNSCPLSRLCRPTISSSFVPFSCFQSFPASGSFQMSQFFASGGEEPVDFYNSTLKWCWSAGQCSSVQEDCYALRRKWVLHKLLAVSSVLMNYQYILNKVSLNRKMHKTMLYIDWLTKIWPEEPTLYFPCSSGIVFP